MQDNNTPDHVERAIDEYHSCLRWLYSAITAKDKYTRAVAITKALGASRRGITILERGAE